MKTYIYFLLLLVNICGCSRGMVNGDVAAENNIARLEITPDNPQIPVGVVQQFTATVVYKDYSTEDVTADTVWTSSNPTVAEIHAPGEVETKIMGTATITGLYKNVTATTTLAINPASLVSIQVNPTSVSLAGGLSEQLQVTGIYSDTTTANLTNTVTWSTSDATVATVSNSSGTKGRVTAQAVGTATITATIDSFSETVVVTVTAATLTSLQVTPINTSIAKGTNVQMYATGIYSDNTTADLTSSVAWSSTNTGVASIVNTAPNKGRVSGVNTGSSTIIASIQSLTAQTSISVTTATLNSVAISPTNLSLANGSTRQYRTTGTYSDSSTQDLTESTIWTSSNPAVASISNANGQKGFLTTHSVGTATITAVTSSFSVQTNISVTAAVLTGIQILPAAISLPLGISQTYQAIGTYSDTSTSDITTQVTWSSSDPSVATISNASGTQGKITTHSVGSVTISASLSGSTANANLSVTAATLSSIAVTPANSSIAKGLSQQYTAIGTYSDSSTQNLTNVVTWSTAHPSIAGVSNAAGSKGLLTAVNMGATTISAHYSGNNGQTNVTVTAPSLLSINVNSNNSIIPLGLTTQVNATGLYSDGSQQDITADADWDVSVSSVANIDATGLLSTLSEGDVAVVAELNSITGQTTIHVDPAKLLSIAVTPSNPQVFLLAIRQFTATGTYTDGTQKNLTNDVNWQSGNLSRAVFQLLGIPGLVTCIALGPVTVTATLGPVSGNTVMNP